MTKTDVQQGDPLRRGLRILMVFVGVVSTLWPYMFSIAGAGTTFTLTNRTRYYLHAKVNNESHTYIAPGGSVVTEVTAPTSVFATVQYAPGQGAKGRAERTVDIQATTTSSGGASTCTNESNEGSTCNTTEPTSTTTATPGRWDVVSTDFSAE